MIQHWAGEEVQFFVTSISELQAVSERTARIESRFAFISILSHYYPIFIAHKKQQKVASVTITNIHLVYKETGSMGQYCDKTARNKMAPTIQHAARVYTELHH